ncbi:S9 family peptidase [Chryseobacterium koreense]|uniref:alpha/beta hydrolase family protein n=1 Tax=Chryseobacterium koreense TaxID=232216 RepID=UPI0026F004FC|nr:prolyl oligopeptidase family serine peptidase [Chryseobacterium koreense]
MNQNRSPEKNNMVLFDTYGKKDHVINLENVSTVSFLSDQYLLASANQKRELWNLQKGTKIMYRSIKASDLLKSAQQFAILHESSTLQVISKEGVVLSQLENVKSFVTDHAKVIYAEKRQQGGIWKFKNGNFKKIYDQIYDVERMELSNNKKHLIVHERNENSNFRRIVAINTDTDNIEYPLGIDFRDAGYFVFKEIQDTEFAFIKATRFEPVNSNIVNVWYGNDRDMKSKQWGQTPKSRYFYTGSGRSFEFKFDDKTTVFDIGSSQYFLYFRKEELQDYTHFAPFINLNLYDATTSQSQNIGIIEPEVYSSRNGKHIIFKLKDVGWTILDTGSGKVEHLDSAAISNPVFSRDDMTVYFESDNDLWCYSIPNKKLFPLKVAAGSQTHILNADKKSLCTGFNFYQATLDNTKPILIETKNEQSNETVYFSIIKNKVNKTLIRSKNKISFFTYTDDLKHWSWMEENYNLPFKLCFSSDRKTSVKVLYDGESIDKDARNIKQETLSYSLADGRKLKGILYYPKKFVATQIYPVIVHIYQIQHNLANEYLMPDYDVVGFNIRTLIEKNYFVFLPDTVIDERGPGIAAMESIDKALDKLFMNRNINCSKVGLIGHSFGGYLTNFIATHSKRFATYISGSGVSDIISSYFSFNYNFTGPHYWQLETGQYRMNSSFADNKELYYRNNPIFNVEKANAPILLWTGTKDENVVSQNTVELYLGLKRYNKNVIALFYPESGHDLSTNFSQMKDLNIRVLEWFDYFLKDKKGILWIEKQIEEDA